MTAPALPEVRQCQDQSSHLYGATAVAGAGITAGMWGVMDPEQGGHWATPEDVANWAVIVQPGTTRETPVVQQETTDEAAQAGGEGVLSATVEAASKAKR